MCNKTLAKIFGKNMADSCVVFFYQFNNKFILGLIQTTARAREPGTGSSLNIRSFLLVPEQKSEHRAQLA